MAKWTGLTKKITLADAETERDQLFDRPAREPSPATAAALKRAVAPPLSADDLAQLKARRRPRGAS